MHTLLKTLQRFLHKKVQCACSLHPSFHRACASCFEAYHAACCTGMHGFSLNINGIIMLFLGYIFLLLGCLEIATSTRRLLSQHTQLRLRPLTVMLTCCMEWSMQMALGILQESMDERVDLSSCQVWTITSSLSQTTNSIASACMTFAHSDTVILLSGCYFLRTWQHLPTHKSASALETLPVL